MTRRKKVLLPLFAVTLTVAFVSLMLGPRGPSYQGQSIDEWSDILIRHSDSAEAHAAFREMGAPALNHLWREYTAVDSPTRERFMAWMIRFAPAKFRLTFAASRRHQACFTLLTLGPAAAPLLPRLDTTLGDRDRTVESAAICEAIGPAAIPTLTRHLTNRDPYVRLNCAISVHSLTRNTLATIIRRFPSDILVLPPKFPEIDANISTMDHRDRSPALPEIILNAFADCLQDPDGNVRSEAVSAFNFLGPAAGGAVSRLHMLAAQTNAPSVSTAASNALIRLANEGVNTNLPPAR
jgi:hypothetical protein